MPLAPDVQAYLEAFEKRNLPDISQLTVQEARTAREGFFIPRPIPSHPELAISNEIIALPNNPTLPIRIYRPKALKNPAPCLVYFHGGGFVVGTLDHYDPWCVDLTRATQCIIISIDYRLAPEHPFPLPFDDCYHATHWIHRHAKRLCVDPQNIFLSGDSAGGCLALAVALKMRDKKEHLLRGIIAIYPVISEKLDTASHDRYAGAYGGAIFSRAAMRWFFGHYIQNPKDYQNPYAIPLNTKDLSNMPPSFIATAECDPLRDEGHIFAERLREAGNPCNTHDYPGMIHGFTLCKGMPYAESAREDLIHQIKSFVQTKSS